MSINSPRILFVHHSVGRLILSRGGLRQQLAARIPSSQLWDHDYNKFGLSDGSARSQGRSFPIPDDNTDPDGLVELLRRAGTGHDLAEEFCSFDIVVLKSCYPNNAIASDEAEKRLRITYRLLLEAAVGLPIQVVLATSPPLAPERTNKEERERAVRTAEWLTRSWRGPNARVADIFSAISFPDGPFKGGLAWTARRPWPMDSHPGHRGCAQAAAVVVDALVEAALTAAKADADEGSP